jgi:hypothetical protein
MMGQSILGVLNEMFMSCLYAKQSNIKKGELSLPNGSLHNFHH